MVKKVFYLARDFFRVVRGTDYFHQPQPLGLHYTDARGYHNDMRGKARWTGAVDEARVPLLFIPGRGAHAHFPIMIVQYGLGSLDVYFSTGEPKFLSQAKDSARWVLHHLNAEGYLDNLFPELEPGPAYHSANSGMCQGEALSLLTRVHRELGNGPGAPDGLSADRLERAIRSIYGNMLKPLEQGGTTFGRRGLRFCEVCRKDEYVVLNGWIYALFGVWDYWRWSQEAAAKAVFDASVALLVQELPSYSMAWGWSYYDNKGRVCSPFYHRLHIALLDALSRLAPDAAIEETLQRFARGDGFVNRWRFTVRKVVEKLRDQVVYSTQQ